MNFCRKLVALIFASFAFVFFVFGENSYALELTKDVDLVQGNFNSQIMPFSWNSTQCPYQSLSNSWNNVLYCDGGYQMLTSFALSIPNRTYSAGDWIVIPMYFSNDNQSVSNHSIITQLKYIGSNPVDLIELKSEQISVNSSVVYIYFRVWDTFTDNALNIGTSEPTSIRIQQGNSSGVSRLVMGVTTVYHEKSVNSTDYTTIINNIQQNINNTNSKLDSVNNNLNDLKQSQDRTADAAEKQADTAQDTYDKTIEETDKAKEDASGMSLDIDFANPFSDFVDNIKNQSCGYSIPELGALLNKPDAYMPCWFSSNVRAVVTPVISGLSTILLIGFVMRWLHSNKALGVVE